MITKTQLFNIVLVHVARTWERLRIEQQHEEMPLDNIESAEAIVGIADEIMEDKVLLKFRIPEENANWDWDRESGEGCSDIYIEKLAYEKIIAEYLDY